MLNVNESATSIKPCYKMLRFAPEIWRYAESPYLCSVFFIVLDLRLTKDWLSGIDSLFLCSFFRIFEGHITRMNIMRTILLTLLLSVAAISSFTQTNTYRECTSQNFKIISYTRELSPQGCQQSPIYVKPKRS